MTARPRAARLRQLEILRREEQYIVWLMETRRLDMGEAIAYARKGEEGLRLHRAAKAPPPKTAREREAAREADLPPDVRRWKRVDANCPHRDCTLPVHHSGPHRHASRLQEMLENSIAELDRREQCINR